MDVETFLNELRRSPDYAGQIVYVHETPAREAIYAPSGGLPLRHVAGNLARIGIDRLYCHQAEAIGLAGEGKDVLVATGTASGKTLCYALPIMEHLRADPQARALLLFPTKALCQDQFRHFGALLEAVGCTDRLAGVLDGDTPSPLRRKLRDRASVIFSNPDMLHTAMMPQHARWAEFFGHLKMLVLDEMHVYSGLFGSNMALLFRRFFRL
ncbi:MAG: DEAD/DEAH box helicase [Candidatus Latescibacterota bacterium]